MTLKKCNKGQSNTRSNAITSQGAQREKKNLQNFIIYSILLSNHIVAMLEIECISMKEM
jgi:hypothetical protein